MPRRDRWLAHRLLALLVVLGLALPPSAVRADPTSTGRLPLASEPTAAELLPMPATMPRCPGVTIVEWRPSARLPSLTGPSPAGFAQIERACAAALARYPSFLASRRLRFNLAPLHARVMVMGANMQLDGAAPRHLNDITGRFAVVLGECCVWGVYDSLTKALFVRNDPFLPGANGPVPNPHFLRTAHHEMAHLLNDQWGVKAANFPRDKVRDEALAEDWVRYLGITIAADSSEENYARLAADAGDPGSFDLAPSK